MRSRESKLCYDQTGKHGRGKVKFTGIDIFTGSFVSRGNSEAHAYGLQNQNVASFLFRNF